ncbi:CLUMA_CG002929, isoform A [Clunio marinus]|uniref:CLUMA_CG002929, isoform A n=1 Tax=Clunio marinus TaxID=568069 RepID=A0A1J1HM68_9DIPT|nr:CLUMA_CG002929, isoform A [Clunio marinus]
MCIPRVDRFLLCLTLESGGFIIGLLSTIFSVTLAFGIPGLVIVLAIKFKNEYNSLTDPDEKYNLLVIFIIGMVIALLYTTFMTVNVTASLLMTIGVRRKRPLFMKLFIWMLAIGVIICLLQSTGAIIGIIKIGNVYIAVLIVSLIILVLNIYAFICVYSLYDLFIKVAELQRRETGQEQSRDQIPKLVYWRK